MKTKLFALLVSILLGIILPLRVGVDPANAEARPIYIVSTWQDYLRLAPLSTQDDYVPLLYSADGRLTAPLFNSVLRARLSPDSVDVAIEGAKARCASRNVPMLWWTGPTTRPTNLEKYLEAHGFTKAENAPGMAVDLLAMNEELQAPPGLVIEQIGDVEAPKQWYQVFKEFFGFPDDVENAWVDFLLV